MLPDPFCYIGVYEVSFLHAISFKVRETPNFSKTSIHSCIEFHKAPACQISFHGFDIRSWIDICNSFTAFTKIWLQIECSVDQSVTNRTAKRL